MIDAFWIPLLPPYLIGLVLSFAVEALLTPRPVAPWRRPMAAVGVHVGVWTLAFALELMLFRRPYFAVANVLAIELLIVLVSNAKYKALKEPFVYPDFEYFLDAIKHPRLYLPFFGLSKALAAGGGYGLALWMGLTLEESVSAGTGFWLMSFAELPEESRLASGVPVLPFFIITLSLGFAGLLVAMTSGKKNVVKFYAIADLRKIGLIASLWAYGRNERLSCDMLRAKAPFAIIPAEHSLKRPESLPDMVVVQSESFFDARREFSILRTDLLPNFDLLKLEALQHGQLAVDAWGANTVRTEFGFLSGMNPLDMGVHRYNPYRCLATKGFPTLASHLRSLGYRTICIHPYYPSFYKRDQLLPLLGFDEFISLDAFEGNSRVGAYVSDCAVGRKLASILAQRSCQPLYVHVITMENHGPLHWEEVSAVDAASVLNSPMPPGCEDLVAYARHLRNGDAMLGMLRAMLIDRPWPASLCLFGDHVPIMSTVYASLGEPDGRTDYLLWATGSHNVPQPHGWSQRQHRETCELAFDFLAASGYSLNDSRTSNVMRQFASSVS